MSTSEIGEKPSQFICSDGGCRKNPGGEIYYRVVDFVKNKVVCTKKFTAGTVNFAEYLGIIEALKYREREGLFDLDIYTDSHVAKQRVNKKRRKKPYDISVRPDLYEEVKRADEWLNAYKGKIDVKFRYSKYWGEIPADFGNKKGGVDLYKEEVTKERKPQVSKEDKKKEKIKIHDTTKNGRITKEFYGESYNVMKKIANHNQLMFSMLYYAGVDEVESYMAVFPECKTLYTKTEYVSVGKVNYPREVPDLVEIGWRAKQYASCSKVKTVCGMLLRNEVEINYQVMSHTKEGLLKILRHTLGKLDMEVQRGKTYVANSMKNIVHEIAVLDGHLKEETNTNNYFIGTLNVEQLQQKKMEVVQKDTQELDTIIEQAVLSP